MKKFKSIIFIFMAILIFFNTLAITAHASETTDSAYNTQTFIPFRSYIASYISLHSSEKSDVLIGQWLKIWYEETTFTGHYSTSADDITKWASKYYSSYSLIGGNFVSEDDAKGTNVTFNSDFDQFLANTIKANGLNFMNQWLDAYNESPEFYGKQVFIDYFHNTDYINYPATAQAITELTSTDEGMAWLKNYSYANTGDSEDSIGVGLLKLLTLNWSKLNTSQADWCKEYLPFLLKNYTTYGVSAIAAQTNNSNLYDFMARSALGAKYTAKSIVSSKTCQQEFFDYVVESRAGFGSFIQNLIDGRTYTAATPNRTISGIDLSGIQAPSGMFGVTCADGDADYTASSIGDGDFDWFGHGLYLYETNQSNPDFATVDTLIRNNTSTDWLYLDWLSRFKSINETSINWATVTNYYLSSPTDSHGYGGHYYLTGSGFNANGPADSQTSDGSAIYSVLGNGNTLYRVYTGARNMVFTLNAFQNIVVNYRQNISYKASSVTIRFGSGYMMNYPGDSVLVEIISPTTGGTVAKATCASYGQVTIDIPDSAWISDKSLKLKFTFNPYSSVNYAFNSTNLGSPTTHGFQWRIDCISENYNGGASGLDGYTWSDWKFNYASDYEQVILYRNATTNTNIEESELIHADIKDYDNRTVYTYTPSILSKDSWTITINKDLGTEGSTDNIILSGNNISGTTSASAYTACPAGRYTNSLANVSHGHLRVSTNVASTGWQNQTTVTATASGSLNIVSGIIKRNAKSITVTTPATASITLRSNTGEILMTQTGTGFIKLDISGLSELEKQGSYLVINYSSLNIASTYCNSTDWFYFPAASVSAFASINSVSVGY